MHVYIEYKYICKCVHILKFVYMGIYMYIYIDVYMYVYVKI